MENLQNYAKLILNLCINLLPDEKLLIWCPIEADYFARIIREEAYKIGASKVEICLEDRQLDQIFYTDENEHPRVISALELTSRNEYLVKEKFKMIWLCACDFFDAQNEKSFITDKVYANMPQIAWSVAYVATIQWAKLLFEDLEDAAALEKLWGMIFSSCRLNDENFLEHWRTHILSLHTRAKALNLYNFKTLHFKSGIGTDLTVQLHNKHQWISCTGKTKSGQLYITIYLPKKYLQLL